MGSVCCCVCWKSSVWMMILVQCTSSPVREQVWGWSAGGAENSGVTLILGLYPVRLYLAGKGKAVGFNPGRKHQDLVPCINKVVRSQGVVGAALQEWDHPLQCCEKREEKGETGGKCRFPSSLGPNRGYACSLLPLCLLGFALHLPTPSL